MRVVWSEEARLNLEEIGDFVAAHDRRAAKSLVARILKAAALLDSHPLIGRRIGEKGDRQLVIAGTRYIVHYAVAAERCDILAVFHSSRQRPPI